jgi:flagellar basal body P-ring formation protein FlgA
MRKPIPLALAALLCLGSSASLADDGQPGSFDGEESLRLNLRTSVMVDDDVIRLSDLFMEPVALGDVPIAQAPAPGKTLIFDARFLSHLARAYRLDWRPSSKYERVLVGRVSQRIEPAAIQALLSEAVRERANGNAMEVVIDGGDIEFALPTDIPATMIVQNLQVDTTTQRFAAILTIPAEGPTMIQHRVTGSVYPVAEIPVLARALPAGETVQDGDVTWSQIRIDRLVGNVVTDLSQLVGMTTRRPVRAGQILRASDLVMTPTVRKNSLVTLSLQTGQMVLTVMGRVLEDAPLGKAVRVVNINSKKELTGIVQNSTTVMVPLAGSLAIN